MPIVVTDEAEILMLQMLLNVVNNDDQIIHLYTNDVTPVKSTLQSSLDEATEAGYAPITLTGTTWGVTQVAGVTTAEYPPVTFNLSEAATLYGYYVTNTDDDIMWVERFSGAPFELPGPGGSVAISQTLELN